MNASTARTARYNTARFVTSTATARQSSNLLDQLATVSLTFGEMRAAHFAHDNSPHTCDAADRFSVCSWFPANGF